MTQDRLFTPLQLGNVTLGHRIVMPPLTRCRADDRHVPMAIMKEYYSQRASLPGTLLIAEATAISPRAAGQANIPGIWSSEQIAAWKDVTGAVHNKKCLIYLQLWDLGRKADPMILERAKDGPYHVIGASDLPLKPIDEGGHKPHALTIEEIRDVIDEYADAAKNAMLAGFDGVEIHGANGYLVDQFWQEPCNNRTDIYGGSIENRTRFGIEVTEAIIEAVGDSRKVAMRISPWSEFDGLEGQDPVPQFLHVVSELKKLNLAYLHLVESRITGENASSAVYDAMTRRNDPFIELWGPQSPVILAGGFTAETAKETADYYSKHNVCIAIGRYYISTPDLPFRIREGLALNPYHRPTFYKAKSPEGYIDYPFSPEYTAEGGSGTPNPTA